MDKGNHWKLEPGNLLFTNSTENKRGQLAVLRPNPKVRRSRTCKNKPKLRVATFCVGTLHIIKTPRWNHRATIGKTSKQRSKRVKGWVNRVQHTNIYELVNESRGVTIENERGGG